MEPGRTRSVEIEGSQKMINLEIAHRDFESVEYALAPAPVGRRELVPLLATQEARSALSYEQEYATRQAADVLSQADEALVMG
jgi:hypothetical protein